MSSIKEGTKVDADVIDRMKRISTATLTMVLLKRGIRRTWMRGPAPLFPDALCQVGLVPRCHRRLSRGQHHGDRRL